MGRPRLRELGIEIGRLPAGPHNALTDVPGVRVGHVTLIAGDGPLVVGRGPVRTGVTAIHLHPGHGMARKAAGAAFVLNGFGKSRTLFTHPPPVLHAGGEADATGPTLIG